MDGTAIVLAHHKLQHINGKTAHALVRGSKRFRVVAVVDPDTAPADAGELLDGRSNGIPVFASLAAGLEALSTPPDFCIVGIATHGGRLAAELRKELLMALRNGISIVNGLHQAAADDPDLVQASRDSGARIIDIRRPKPFHALSSWTGAIYSVKAPRLAVLGVDCAIGKRTTATLLVETCRQHELYAEMIYTGQTGWMKGNDFGFILDSTLNDFVSGELERAIVACDRERSPDLIVLEGQSSLRNPSGPCGAEFLLSGAAKGVILQCEPGRRYFEGFETVGCELPALSDEIRLVEAYGARTLAVTLSGRAKDPSGLRAEQGRLRRELGIPVVCPKEDGLDELLPILRRYIDEERRG